jgi:hypothetical protein
MTRIVFSLLLLGVVACAQGSVETSDAKTGALALALTGSDAHGVAYRLRNATFEIYGCPGGGDYSVAAAGAPGSAFAGSGGSAGGPVMNPCVWTTISSEDNPDAAVLTKRLVPGYYTINLQGDWYLEEMTSAGPQRVAQALLLNGSTQSTYVWDNGNAMVSFQFGVGGDLIDFRHGDLSIGIQVEQPGDHDCYYGMAGYGGSYASCGSAGAGGGVAGYAGVGVAGGAGSF